MTNWTEHLKHMACRTCVWFIDNKIVAKADVEFALITDEQIKPGRCRKRAPTMTGYPVVFVTDWCGDHKVDELKLE